MKRLLHHRFLKFGIVGSSGILVNLSVLWLCQEFVFHWVHLERLRLNLSLLCAISLSTFSNYYWNRFWTWRDRQEHITKGFWVQMIQYYAVSWIAITLQFLFTNILQLFMHYLAANLIAIALAAIFNFKSNDIWTFSGRTMTPFWKRSKS